MATWLIVLIVIIAIFILIILPGILFSYAGSQILKMLTRVDINFKESKGPKMDISFYNQGPLKEATRLGLEFMDSLEVKEVTIESYDGLKLHAYYIKNPYKTTNKFFLGMHGYRSGPKHEFALYLKKYLENGYNVLIPDERACYKSEGEYITMGHKEAYDTVSWTNYLIKEHGEDIKILLQGVSMGASTVLIASALGLPKQVMGIISDCGYTSFEAQMRYVIKTMVKIPCFPIVNVIGLYIKRVGVSFKDLTPIEAVSKTNIPIFFAHGELDQIVPVKFAKELYENCHSAKHLYIVPNANHAESCARDVDKYFSELKNFFTDF